MNDAELVRKMRIAVWLPLKNSASIKAEGIVQHLCEVMRDPERCEYTIFIDQENVVALEELRTTYGANFRIFGLNLGGKTRGAPTLTGVLGENYPENKPCQKSKGSNKLALRSRLVPPTLKVYFQRVCGNLNNKLCPAPIPGIFQSSLRRMANKGVATVLAYCFPRIDKRVREVHSSNIVNLLFPAHDKKLTSYVIQQNKLHLEGCQAALKNEKFEAILIPNLGYGIPDTSLPVIVMVAETLSVEPLQCYISSKNKRLFKYMQANLNKVDFIICLSEYVSHTQRIGSLELPREKIRIIPGYSRTWREESQARQDKSELRAEGAKELRLYFRGLMPKHIGLENYHSWILYYLADFPFEETEIIYCSTNDPTHHQALIEAFDIILRRRRRSCKLFLTSSNFPDYNDADERKANETIALKCLHYDILSVFMLPSTIHRAFYKVAALALVPETTNDTLPQQFGEAIAMHTPVVLSGNLRSLCTVHPEISINMDNPERIADRLIQALDRRQFLLDEQVAVFKKMNEEHSNPNIGLSYESLFHKIIASKKTA